MKQLVNFPKLIKRIWILLWIILFLLLVLKYLFNIWYPIIVENNTINNLFLFIDNTLPLKLIISFSLYIISGNIIFLTYIKRFKYYHIYEPIIYSCFLLTIVITKYKYNTIGVIFELLIIIIAIIYNLKTKTYKKNILNILMPIVIYLLLNIWQLNIYLVRNLDLELLKDLPSMYSIILMFDYYIFLIITWIGVNYMSIFSFGWLFAKDVTELEALKAEELNKKHPDEEYIKQIDALIEQKKEA